MTKGLPIYSFFTLQALTLLITAGVIWHSDINIQ